MWLVRKPIWIVLTVFFIAYLFLILRLHFNYSTTDSDLAIYDQQIWFLSQGRLVDSSFKGYNAFGDHFGFIEVFIAPFYWLWDSVVVLLVLQTAAIVLSAYPVYLTFKKHLRVKEIWAILFIVGYLIYFGFQAATIFPFHLATFSIVFIAWTIYAVLEERWTLYWPMLFLTMMCKEDLPLLGMVLGVYLLLKRKYLIGSTTLLISMVYFYIVIYKIMPYFVGRKYGYFVSQLGDSPTQIIVNSILDPLKALVYFFTPLVKLRTMLSMFASFAFLPLLSPTFLLLLSPFLAERFLNDTLQRHLPWMHYSANQGPILAYGAIFGLANLGRFLGRTNLPAFIKSNLAPLLIVSMLTLSLAVTWVYQMPLLKLASLGFYVPAAGSKDIFDALKLVPEQAIIGTQSGLQPHLSHRDNILKYPDPSLATDEREDDLPADAPPEDYKIPPKAEYLLMSADAFHWRPETREGFLKQIDYVKSLPEWEVIFDREATTLFRKRI